MALGVALFALAPVTTLAAEPSGLAAETEAADGDAAHWYRRGVEAYKASRLEEAERSFRRAFELERSYEIAGNLAQTLFDLGKMAEAANVMRYAVSLFPPTVSPEARARAEQIVAEASSRSVELALRCTVAGAALRVARRPIGSCPLALPINVEPGLLVIEASHPGYRSFSTEVSGKAGERLEVAIDLVASEEMAPSAPPDATLVDTDTSNLGAAPGVAVGAAALATAVVGGVLRAGASSHATHADETLAALRSASGRQYPCAGASAPASCADILADREAHDDLTNASIPVLLGAGALAVVSGVLLGLSAAGDTPADGTGASVASARRARPPRWLAAPWWSPSRAGIAVQARY